MNLSHYTVDIFKPEISWDSSRRLLVEQMDDTEKLAIAKQSTYRLRYSSPEIRNSFKSVESIRERYAKLFLTNELILAGLKSDAEINHYKRMFRLLDAQIRNHATTISRYRKDAGYRISALVYLSACEFLSDADSLYADLDALASIQKTLDNASQLEIIIRTIGKRGTGIDAYDVSSRANELTASLDVLIERVHTCLKERAVLIEGKSVSSYIDTQLAKQSSGLDAIHATRLKFSVVKAGFEAVNECLCADLAGMVWPLIDANQELRLAA